MLQSFDCAGRFVEGRSDLCKVPSLHESEKYHLALVGREQPQGRADTVLLDAELGLLERVIRSLPGNIVAEFQGWHRLAAIMVGDPVVGTSVKVGFEILRRPACRPSVHAGIG